jgi:3-isopropylmalate/(R)-2-methylmalate dehydratase small subunit
MDAFTTHTGRALPLRRANVDTDQIIPAEYLKRITRTGFEDALFASWRTDPGFVLNDAQFAGATILVAGTEFGTGSSREHAVWALHDYGFKVVLSSRFGDIFRGNSLKNGLLTVLVDQDVIEQLWRLIEADPTLEITVDLENLEIRFNGETISFELDASVRQRLLEGADDITITLRHSEEIDAYEQTIPSFKPDTLAS